MRSALCNMTLVLRAHQCCLAHRPAILRNALRSHRSAGSIAAFVQGDSAASPCNRCAAWLIHSQYGSLANRRRRYIRRSHKTCQSKANGLTNEVIQHHRRAIMKEEFRSGFSLPGTRFRQSSRRTRRIAAMLAATARVWSASRAHANTYTWNPGTIPATPSGGMGNWDPAMLALRATATL